MRLFTAYNLGDAALAPECRLEAPDKQDKTMLAQSQLNAMTVVQQAIEKGIPIDVAAYFERYDIPLLGIEEGETLELETFDESSGDDAANDVMAEIIYAAQWGKLRDAPERQAA